MPGPVRFDGTLSSHMALQQAPARAAVYGTIDPSHPSASHSTSQELPEVVVSVATHRSQGIQRLYSTRATVEMVGGKLRWIAYLTPTAGGPDEFAIHATLSSERVGTTLWHVVFGKHCSSHYY